MSKFSFTSIKGNPRKTPSPKSTPPRNQGLILLKEEILHRQGCIKPVNDGNKLPINWCRISAINSSWPYFVSNDGNPVIFFLDFWNLGH